MKGAYKKSHKTTLKWVPAEEAAKWPEGCKTLMAEYNNGINFSTIQFRGYHRPDMLQIDHENYYKYYENCYFCFLSE